jgi:hypothetical protein
VNQRRFEVLFGNGADLGVETISLIGSTVFDETVTYALTSDDLTISVQKLLQI